MKKEYADFYGSYTDVIERTERDVLCELNSIIDELTTDSEHTPAEHILSRIKDPESLCEKLRKDSVEPTAENGLNALSDIVGIRVVTHFVGDVYAIADKIRNRECWTTIKTKDYIASPKPNGYRSLHMILSLPDSPVRAEIQLRTIAMDCWASLEHQMKYKKNIGGTSLELITSELKRCADEIASTDLSMQTIRELIEKQV